MLARHGVIAPSARVVGRIPGGSTARGAVGSHDAPSSSTRGSPPQGSHGVRCTCHLGRGRATKHLAALAPRSSRALRSKARCIGSLRRACSAKPGFRAGAFPSIRHGDQGQRSRRVQAVLTRRLGPTRINRWRCQSEMWLLPSICPSTTEAVGGWRTATDGRWCSSFIATSPDCPAGNTRSPCAIVWTSSVTPPSLSSPSASPRHPPPTSATSWRRSLSSWTPTAAPTTPTGLGEVESGGSGARRRGGCTRD